MAQIPGDVELDSGEKERLLEQTKNHELPEPLATLVTDYQSLTDARSPFVFKWLHLVCPSVTLPCVDAENFEKTVTDKVISILFITLLDDAIEKHENRRTFHELGNIPYPERPVDVEASGIDPEYVEFGQVVWSELHDRFQASPNYETYIDLYRYDLGQVIASIDYSSVTNNQLALASVTDLELAEAHNMGLLSYADIDLMHSRADHTRDYSSLREAVLIAQLMARIANWVTTWEREIREGDFTAGPVVYALENDIVDPIEVRAAKSDPKIADRITRQIKRAGIEAEFMERWRGLYAELSRYDGQVESMDLTEYVEATREVLRFHVAARGHI